MIRTLRKTVERLNDDSLPNPGDPPQEIEPDLRDRLAWLVKHGRRVAWTLGADEVVVTPEAVHLVSDSRFVGKGKA